MSQTTTHEDSIIRGAEEGDCCDAMSTIINSLIGIIERLDNELTVVSKELDEANDRISELEDELDQAP